MAFWSERQVEPKRKFRWLLYFTGMPQFVVKSVKKPSYNVETTPHQFLNYEFNYPGRVKWNPIDITIVDPVNPDSTKSLYKILENSGYVIPSQYNESKATTISKKGMVEALGTQIQLVQLKADGVTEAEKWRIHNPLITSVEFDTLDYSADELLNINISITYDYATIDGVSGNKNLKPTGIWNTNSQQDDGFNPEG